MPMNQHERTRQAFARQAATMASAPAFTEASMIERLRVAVGAVQDGRVLDLACGPGIVTVELARDAREVVAFDLTPEMLQKARERCAQAGLMNVRFEQGTAEALPFADASFDAVVTRFTMHHFASPAVVASQLARVVRPGGRIVIADSLSSHIADEAELHNALEILRDPSHIRMLSREQLLAIIQEAGFTVLSESTWERPREFEEWAQIVDDPTRTDPLRTVMYQLARAGMSAGINLHLDAERIVFVHHMLLVVAEKPSGKRNPIN